MEDEGLLNDIWNIYFHDPFDEDWTISSYKRISSMSTVEEFWQNHECLKPHIHKGMFFVMREAVFPNWDDAANINGGCLSIKIFKELMYELWEEICIKMLGETLLKEEYRDKWNSINGISTSPKKHFCILKIWLKDCSLADKNYFDISSKYYGDILYKSNIENISNDNQYRMKT